MKVKTHNINNESDLRKAQEEMYRLAKEGNEPFYNLIELMKNEHLIMTAIHNIKSNQGSKTAGIDGKIIDDYLQMPYEELIDEIRNAIHSYNPSPVRRKWIEKENSDKLRPLGIPVVLDRLIQEITKMVIEPIAEAKFYHYSFGYRPYRSTDQAMAEIIERIRRNKTYWVIEGDIKGFFDNINHNKLIEMLWKLGIKDKRVLSIIKKMLKSGIVEEDGRLYPSDVGSPQGGIISPLLANIYLNHFDWMIAEKFQEHPAKYDAKDVSRSGLQRVRKRHEDIYLIRYADDWIILCKSEHKAKTILKEVEKYFKHKLSLELSKEKTLITDIQKTRAKFLGFEIFAEKARASNKIVGKIIPNISKTNAKLKQIGKDIRRLNIIKDARDKALQVEKVNSKIIGLTEYFAIANCANLFKAWDMRIQFQQYKTFCRLYHGGRRARFKEVTIPANKVSNRIKRHERRKDGLYFLEVDGIKMGITKFSMTPSRKAMKVNLELSPYTEEGREIYERNTGKTQPLMRVGTLYSYERLKSITYKMHSKKGPKTKFIYNYEYYMNREYAYNRDKGRCKCCGTMVDYNNYNCHHKNPNLVINKINKVNNLTTLCTRCHRLIHNNIDVFSKYDKKMAKKIETYRKVLKEAKTTVK